MYSDYLCIMTPDILKSKVFQISDPHQFEEVALMVFHFQYHNVKVYREFVDFLGIDPIGITQIDKIPFLPIEFFKSKRIIQANCTDKFVFTSSATTGAQVSRHYVVDPDVYHESFSRCFELFYGDPREYRIMALLPGYLERSGSSLVYMMDSLIQKSGHSNSGFFLHDTERLKEVLQEPTDRKTLLLGVSFALWELAESGLDLSKDCVVMETGGMKGRRREVVRAELHEILKRGFGLPEIHSEYGMTELFSQAYSSGDGLFSTPPWMKVLIRDPEDPLSIQPTGKGGGINVIDLANVHTCAFIATQDLGKIHSDGRFEVLGRFDYSDVRGCNLMVQ